MAGPGLSYDSTTLTNSANGVVIHDFRAWEEMEQGRLVFLRDDNTWRQVNALVGGLGAEQLQVRGITLNWARENQPVSVCISDPNFYLGDTANSTKGKTYIASDSVAGSMVQYAANSLPSYIVIAGTITSPTTMALILKSNGFNPDGPEL